MIFVRSGAWSAAVIGFYSVLILLMLGVRVYGTPGVVTDDLAPFIDVVLLLYLARYLTTRYRIDDRSLYAYRLFGSRRIPLAEISRIQRTNLRSLAPVGFIGTWGGRGRVWSPMVGTFDTIHTVSDGLLIGGSGVPAFISPKAPEEFQRELSRRIRSVNRQTVLNLDPA